MSARLAVAAGFVMLLSGCAVTRSPVPPVPSTLPDARRAFDGHTADLVLADGSVWRAAALRIGTEDTSWRADGSGLRVPTCALAEIRTLPPAPTRLRGTWALGGAGLIAGALGSSLFCGLYGSAETGCVVAGTLAIAGASALVGFVVDHATAPARRPGRTLTPTCSASPTPAPDHGLPGR